MANTLTSTYASELALAQLPWFRMGIEEDVEITKRLKATSLGVKSDGNAYYIETGMTGRIAYPTRPITSEGATAIPAHAVATPYAPKWSLKEFGRQVRISTRGKNEGQLIGATDISSEVMKDAMADIAYFTNRWLLGCPSGYLCRITEVTSSAALKVDDMSALREGMVIDSYDALTSGSIGINSQTITGLDFETNTVTVTTTGAAAGDKDWLFIEDTYSAMADGLFSMIAATSARSYGDITITPDVASYAGLTRSSTSKWTSFAKQMESGKFDPKWWTWFVGKLCQAQNVAKSGVNACYGSVDTLGVALEALEYDKKAMNEKLTYGSSTGVSLVSAFLKSGKVDIVPISGFGPSKLVFIDESMCGVREPAGGGWDTSGGGVWVSNSRESTGYPTWTAAWISTLGLIGFPFAHAVLYGFDGEIA